MLKVSTAGDGLLAKCRVIPAGNDKTISPMIFTTHLRKRRERNAAWKTADRDAHKRTNHTWLHFLLIIKLNTVLMRYWLNHYIKSSANHSSHIITAVKPRSEAKSITHPFILIHNSEQQKQTVPVYMTLQVEIQLQNIQNWIHCNKIYQHCSYVFIVYSSTKCLLVDLYTFSHIHYKHCDRIVYVWPY